jgi:hypothetical protein
MHAAKAAGELATRHPPNGMLLVNRSFGSVNALMSKGLHPSGLDGRILDGRICGVQAGFKAAFPHEHPPHPGSVAVSGLTERRTTSGSPCQNHRNQGRAGRAGGGRNRRAGTTVAEWLRELALKAARERPADPTELMLAGAAIYAPESLSRDGQANAEGKHLLPDSVVKIRDQANARKLADARKLLAEFLSQGGSGGGER